MKLMTKRGQLKKRSQLSTNFQEKKNKKLECLIMKKPSQIDITQIDSSTCSNTDPNIAEMHSDHQSQSSQSSD